MVRRSHWYPLGRMVEIVSNSEDIHAAARIIWNEYPVQPSVPSVRLKIHVAPGSAPFSDTPPVPKGDENLISIVDSRSNCAVADLNRGFASILLSMNAAQNTRYFLDTFLEPLTYLILGARHFVMAHAASISLDGRAVLLCGDSGAGKTCLSYKCSQSGWTFLSGDATQIVRESPAREIVGRPYSIRFRPSATKLFPELTGFPVTSRKIKADIECATNALGIPTALHSKLNQVVFLNRTNTVDSARIEQFDRSSAFAWFDKAVFYGDRQVRTEQRDTLNHILEKPAWRLTYSDLSDAEQALRQLMNRV